MCTIYGVLSNQTVVKLFFLANYAVLSRSFCCDLRVFVWKKIEPTNVSVEKDGQISCMIGFILVGCPDIKVRVEAK